MSRFIQLHMLTSYPPSNPNRDDLGRPKTAIMGGTQRMRISSQSLKRAWRTSDIFEDALTGNKGIRSKEMGVQIRKSILSGKPLKEHIENPDLEIKEPEDKKILSEASEKAFRMARVFVDKIGKEQDEELNNEDEAIDEGENISTETETDEKKKNKKGGKGNIKKSNLSKDTLKSDQIVFYTPEDIANIQNLIDKKTIPSEDDLKNLISDKCSGADVAMFGRMLANAPGKNKDAAVQVAHAISVHTVAVEDDYFTAVDDLNRGEVDAGSAHLGEAEFSAGLFYSYICINKNLLIDNLDGEKDLAEKAIAALIEAAAKIAPSGKQNSFANRVRASYILAEKGDDQPRSFSVAYLKSVQGNDYQKEAIQNLLVTAFEMDQAYGDANTQRKAFISNRSDIIKQINEMDKLKPFEKEVQKIKHVNLMELINFAKE